MDGNFVEDEGMAGSVNKVEIRGEFGGWRTKVVAAGLGEQHCAMAEVDTVHSFSGRERTLS